MKKEEQQKQETEFHKRIVNLLRESGYNAVDDDKVAISVENNSDMANVNYNFMYTGIKLPKKEVSRIDAEDAGFKYWSTWNWGEKA